MLWLDRTLSTTAFVVAFCASGLGACSPSVNAKMGAQGSHVITCGNGMSACVAKADKICDEEGYTIIEGVSRPKILGGSSSAYRTRSEVGQLTIHCGLPDEDDEPKVTFKLPPRSDEPVGEAPAGQESPAPPPAAAVCTPGATQACVGPGACRGGQVCLESGRSFGPCDCGDQASGEKSIAPAPTNPSDGPSSSPPGKAPKAPTLPGAAPAPTPLGE